MSEKVLKKFSGGINPFWLELCISNESQSRQEIKTMKFVLNSRSALGLIFSGLAVTTGITVTTFFKDNSVAYAQEIRIAQARTPLAKKLQGKPVVVEIHADWCPACRSISPMMKSLQKDYGNKANFVKFDITNKSTIQAAEAKARQLGLGGFFANYKTRNATVVIIDPATGQIVKQFTKNTNKNNYVVALNQAISQISKK